MQWQIWWIYSKYSHRCAIHLRFPFTGWNFRKKWRHYKRNTLHKRKRSSLNSTRNELRVSRELWQKLAPTKKNVVHLLFSNRATNHAYIFHYKWHNKSIFFRWFLFISVIFSFTFLVSSKHPKQELNHLIWFTFLIQISVPAVKRLISVVPLLFAILLAIGFGFSRLNAKHCSNGI